MHWTNAKQINVLFKLFLNVKKYDYFTSFIYNLINKVYYLKPIRQITHQQFFNKLQN